MNIVRNIILLLMAILLLWPFAGCQTGVTPQTTTGEAVFELSVDVLGKVYAISLDDRGRLISSASLASPDGTVILSMDKGITLLDGDKKPLLQMRLIAADSLPLPPENTQILGPLYELSPKGSTSSPLLRLTLSYNPEDMSKGVTESNVYIAPYDEGAGWGKWSYKNVDADKNRVTTQVSSFGRFAVLAPLAPVPAQAAPAVPASSSKTVSLKEALSNGKPTLAEFGASTCIPCKEMKPILENLAVEYEGKLNVVIVEVYEQMELTRYYKIMTIPTQIVFDSNGKEITRHIGLWPKAQIVTQLKKMGIE